MDYHRKIWLFSFVSLLLIGGCKNKPSTVQKTPSPFQAEAASYTLLENKTSTPKAFAVTTDVHVVLDSASSLKVMDSLQNSSRLLQLDGIAHFTIDSAPYPVRIYTGMMELAAQHVDFTVDAYSDSPGQSLKVLNGTLIATKAYPSDFPNTDTLGAGEMILINRDIDLMEKETFDTASTSDTATARDPAAGDTLQ